MDDIKIPLSKSILVHGEELSELTVKDPELGVLDDISINVTDSGIKLNLGELHKLIAAMAGIPASSARKISLRDLPKFKEVVTAFFGDFLTVG